MPVIGPGVLWLISAYYWDWWVGLFLTMTTFILTGYLAELRFQRSMRLWARNQGWVDLREVRLGGFKSLEPTVWTKRFCGRDEAGKDWEVVAGYGAACMGLLLSTNLIYVGRVKSDEQQAEGTVDRGRFTE